jgi:hypothetical protein
MLCGLIAAAFGISAKLFASLYDALAGDVDTYLLVSAVSMWGVSLLAMLVLRRLPPGAVAPSHARVGRNALLGRYVFIYIHIYTRRFASTHTNTHTEIHYTTHHTIRSPLRTFSTSERSSMTLNNEGAGEALLGNHLVRVCVYICQVGVLVCE